MTRNEANRLLLGYVRELLDDGLVSDYYSGRISDALSVALTPPTVQDVVRVRELVWKEVANGRHLGKGMAAYHRYMVMMANDGTWIWCDMYDSYMPWQNSPSLDAAKAACQAYYEQMVIQHLEVRT